MIWKNIFFSNQILLMSSILFYIYVWAQNHGVADNSCLHTNSTSYYFGLGTFYLYADGDSGTLTFQDPRRPTYSLTRYAKYQGWPTDDNLFHREVRISVRYKCIDFVMCLLRLIIIFICKCCAVMLMFHLVVHAWIVVSSLYWYEN